MSILEEKIKKNKEWFDTDEPSGNHFEKFKNKVSERFPEEKKQPVRSFFVLKIAAAILLLIIAGVLFIESADSNKTFAAIAAEDEKLPKELQELKQYYNDVNKEKITIIDGIQCSDDCEDLKENAKEELYQLEKENKELEEELNESHKDNKVMDAIVNNYQLMNKLLDNVITNLNRTKSN